MSTSPRFCPDTSKALEVIVWLASRSRDIDVYHIVKACFYADKEHLSKHGRPISGDNYDAAQYGPLAKTVYGLLRLDPIEMLALGGNGNLPFSVDTRHRVTASREPNLRRLSVSDIEALEVGLRHVAGKSFEDLFFETHEDPAYLNASGGRMDPRDFLYENLENRDEKANDIAETAELVAY